MKIDEQMTPSERAELLLNKYSTGYIKATVNGIITICHKDKDITRLNHWNEVSRIIKTRL